MSLIEPHASWAALDSAAQAYGSSAEEQRIAALVREVRDHMACEIQGDFDGLMATLTAEPVYHFWGNGEPMVLTGRTAVEGFYRDMIGRGGNQFEVVIDNVIAASTHVVTEGQVKQVYLASALAEQGVTEVAGVAIGDSELWLSNAQLVTVWPNDGSGKLVGEDIYFGQSPLTTLVPITHSDLPDYYELAA